MINMSYMVLPRGAICNSKLTTNNSNNDNNKHTTTTTTTNNNNNNNSNAKHELHGAS